MKSFLQFFTLIFVFVALGAPLKAAAATKTWSDSCPSEFAHLVDRISHFKPSHPDQDEFKFAALPWRSLRPEQQQSIENFVFDRINIWGDTILESDYVLLGDDHQIIKIESIRERNQKVVAVKVMFKHKAVDTTTCEGDIYKYPENTSDQIVFKDCQSGYIYDQIYISPDFSIYETDTVQFEYFE